MNEVKWEITEVWYDAEWDAWMITAYDDEGNQACDSEYEYRKLDAENTGRAYLNSGRCDTVHVYTKDGTRSKTLQRPAKSVGASP